MTPPLNTIIEPLIGLPCWHVQWDVNTNLAMNFGEPSLSIREPKQIQTDSSRLREVFSYRDITIRGEWFLWILQSYWKLTLREGTSTTIRSGQRQMQQALARLDGQRLLGVMIMPITGHTTLSFDLGAQLTLRRQLKKPEDMWILYTPEAYALTMRSDGHVSYQPIDQDEQWHPIEQRTVIST